LFDTIEAYTTTDIRLSDLLDDARVRGLFSQPRLSASLDGDDVMSVVHHDEAMGLHVTIRERVREGDDRTRINVQFSVYRVLAFASQDESLHYANVSSCVAVRALDAVNRHLTLLNLSIDVRDMTVTRIDYACHYVVPAHQSVLYRDVFASRTPAGCDLHVYDNGVTFVQRSRAIKLYDKSVERGDDRAREHEHERVLRFEVSLSSSALAYACRKVFDCERDVRSLIRDEIALRVLSDSFERTALSDRHISVSDNELQMQLRRVFGASYLSASTAHRLITQHDRDVVALGLMSNASFYAWKRKLCDAGVLSLTSEELNMLKNPQNLKVLKDVSRTRRSKNSAKIALDGGVS
jgi:hypothetical protein